MTEILRLQLFRLKKSAIFWVFFALCLALPLVELSFLLVLELIVKTIGEGSLIESLKLVTSTSSVLLSFADYSTISSVLAIICSSIMLSREFSQGTARNAILANKSRTQMFGAYACTSLIIGGIYFICNYALTAVCFGLFIGFGSCTVGEIISSVLCGFVLGLCATLFAESLVCMFLFSTRKTAATLILPLVICLVGTSLVTTIVELSVIVSDLGGYIVSETFLKCVPFYNLIYLTNASTPDGLVVGTAILYDLLFAGGFYALGLLAIRKADLK